MGGKVCVWGGPAGYSDGLALVIVAVGSVPRLLAKRGALNHHNGPAFRHASFLPTPISISIPYSSAHHPAGARYLFQPHLPLSHPDSGIAQLLTATLCYTSPELPTIVPPLSSPAQVSSSRQLRLTITSLGHTAPQFPTLTPSPSLIQALPNWQLRPTAISCSCSTTPTARQSQHRLEWPPAQRGWQREDWGQPRQPVAVAVNWLCSSSCRQRPQFPLPPPASPWRQRPFSHSGEQAGGEGRV